MLIFIVFYTRAVKPKACAQLEHLGLREKTRKNSTKKKHHPDPPRSGGGMLVLDGGGGG